MKPINWIANYYKEAQGNKWFHYFAVFCRVSLALGFIISGIVKVKGERFASGLPVFNPMGHYLEALHHTEYYYTFIGIGQIVVALLLLIPRTAFLGALLYFPVILNICVLTYAVRFEGTRATTFMVLANLFLLCWEFDRLKSLVSTNRSSAVEGTRVGRPKKGKFPFLFFGGVIVTLWLVVYLNMIIYDIRPGNSSEECFNGCPYNQDPVACEAFCDCIYNQGGLLRDCLKDYHAANKTRQR